MAPRIAVVGCGYWGKNLVRNFHELGALAMVCEQASEGCRQARQIAPAVSVVGDFARVLASDVDAVVIATPAATHYELASQALEAGKDVFVEKPLAINYSEGKQLVEFALAHNRILMVGHVLEYHPGIQQLIGMIRNHELGKIQYIYSNRLSLGKIRGEENILWSFAPHDVALILRITGKMPFQVVACGGGYVQPNIADVTVTNLLFDNGVRAHIHVSWLHPFKEHRLVVIGSDKTASFNDVNKELILYDQHVEIKKGAPIPVRGDGELVAFPPDEPLRQECVAFLEAIETRVPPLTDGISGLNVLHVLQCAQRSLIMNGEQVTVAENGLRLSFPQRVTPGARQEELFVEANGSNGHGNGKRRVTVVNE